MTTLLHISVNLSALNSLHDYRNKKRWCELGLPEPINCHSVSITKIGSVHKKRFKLGISRERWSFLEVSRDEYGVLMREEEWKRKKRVVVVKFNQGFGFNGGGGGRENSNTARLLGNLALAIGLTYLSVTGQIGLLLDAFGWVLDAIVSLWLIAMILPIVGLGAFLWWAGRDIVQSSCPNCGNSFQIFRSAIKDDLQLCPFCSQPFSVVGNEFVREPVTFSNQSNTFGEGFDNISPHKKERDFSTAVVDVEAEVKDID